LEREIAIFRILLILLACCFTSKTPYQIAGLLVKQQICLEARFERTTSRETLALFESVLSLRSEFAQHTEFTQSSYGRNNFGFINALHFELREAKNRLLFPLNLVVTGMMAIFCQERG